MTQNKPTVQTDTLFFEQDTQSKSIAVGTAQWYEWLETATSFAFSGEQGNFTARKEPASNHRGSYYWRAYRKKAGKLHRAYLGKSQELTVERLQQVALELSDQPPEHPATPDEKPVNGENQLASLMATKLFIPELPQPLVARPRLVEQLNRASNDRLILLSAPAGSGKTTAVVEWLREAAPETIGRVAWVSLDEGDNEPSRFWHYLARSLKLEQTGIGQSLVRLLTELEPPSLEQLVAGLVNGIVALDENITLVLDDYHLITAPQLHQGMAYLIDHIPPRLRIVLTSRVDPPLPLPRLRLRRQLTELKSRELRFNLAETEAFLKAVSGGLPLSPHNISELESKTEGWAAALQLAGLLMQSHRDLDKFVENFSGKQRFMLDYLAAEVLQSQTEEVQNFLVQTAVLEQFNAELVEELTGCPDGHAMLDRLMQANLFLIPLDDERNWYRYHHLFRQYLLRHLEQTQAEHLPWLHRWAARWYSEHNMPMVAIEHALKAGDLLQAAEWIDATTREMYQRSELRTLWRWLEVIPTEIIEQHPHTGLNCAWVLMLLGRYDEAMPYLQLVEELVERPSIQAKFAAVYVRAWRGEVAAVRAFLARTRGAYADGIELSLKALELIAPPQIFLHCAILVSLARCYAATDDLAAAEREYNQVEQLGQNGGGKYFWLLGIISQARLQAEQGQLQQSLNTCRRALQGNQPQNLPILGLAYLTLGSLWREWNELDKAADYLSRAQVLLDVASDASLLEVYLELARVRQAQGDLEATRQAFQKAAQLVNAVKLSHFDLYIRLEEARLRFGWPDITDELDEVWTGSAPSGNQTLPNYRQELQLLLQARLQLAEGHPAEAVESLERVKATAQAAGRLVALLESLLVQCLAHQQQNQPAQAQALLIQALQLAEPAGFVRLFLDEGQPLLKLLENLANSRQAAELAPKIHQYLARLIEAGRRDVPTLPAPQAEPVTASAATPAALPVASSKPANKLVEPLTEREQAVLQLLATTTMDSQQIADELSIAVSTVRTHIKNIYGKLEVQSRLQAITRTRELGLLS